MLDYFEMLRLEATGQVFNKSQHNELLRQRLRARSKGSIEMKHQNISAVLDQLGLPYIRGYKPRSNFQDLLREVVLAHVQHEQPILQKIVDAIEEQTEPGNKTYRGVLVEPPVPESIPLPKRRQRLPRKLDYAARDERNRNLGHSGESWVLGFEENRLNEASRADLVTRIDWVSERCGDGTGYDIMSFEEDEVIRFIEVKTTNGGSLTPFIISQNELEFSEETEDAFCLYRVFEFSKAPRLFILRGDLNEALHLEAMDYRARLHARLRPLHRHRLFGRRNAERQPEGLARLSGGRAMRRPSEVLPPPSPRKYWTRRGIAEWLVERLAEDVPTLVGIDHGFSFPLRYFETHRLPPDWPAFLDDFQRHWPTDEDHTYVDFVRDGSAATARRAWATPRWRRLTEERCRRPSRCSTSTCRARWRNPPTPACPGCATCAGSWARGSISGRSTAGRFLPGGRRSPRSIPPCGSTPLRPRSAHPTSTTPIPSPPGCAQADRDGRLQAALNPTYPRSAAGAGGGLDSGSGVGNPCSSG